MTTNTNPVNPPNLRLHIQPVEQGGYRYVSPQGKVYLVKVFDAHGAQVELDNQQEWQSVAEKAVAVFQRVKAENHTAKHVYIQGSTGADVAWSDKDLGDDLPNLTTPNANLHKIDATAQPSFTAPLEELFKTLTASKTVSSQPASVKKWNGTLPALPDLSRSAPEPIEPKRGTSTHHKSDELFHDVPRDGNCLFSALVDQRFQLSGATFTNQDAWKQALATNQAVLRYRLADKLIKNIDKICLSHPDIISQCVASLYQEELHTLQKHLGKDVLTAIQGLRGQSVNILTPEQKKWLLNVYAVFISKNQIYGGNAAIDGCSIISKNRIAIIEEGIIKQVYPSSDKELALDKDTLFILREGEHYKSANRSQTAHLNNLICNYNNKLTVRDLISSIDEHTTSTAAQREAYLNKIKAANLHLYYALGAIAFEKAPPSTDAELRNPSYGQWKIINSPKAVKGFITFPAIQDKLRATKLNASRDGLEDVVTP
jgi:hypothetical protein